MFSEFIRKKSRNFDESSMAGLINLHSTSPELCFKKKSTFREVRLFVRFLISKENILISGKYFWHGCWKSTLHVQRINFRRKSFSWNNFTVLLLHHFWTLSGKKSTFGEKYSAKFLKMQSRRSEKLFQENKFFWIK